MDIKNAEIKFLAILKKIKEAKNSRIEGLDSYKYIKGALADESAMMSFFYTALNDIRYVKDLIEGKVIIDAGCGSGAFSVILSLLGAKKVYAADFTADCAEMANFMITIGGLENIEVINSDIGELDLPENNIDGIFSIEAISHYRNYKTFLATASRVLRDGGFLLIRDYNNGASPSIRKKTFKIWDVFENYPEATTIFGHPKSNTCYLNLRKQVIKNEFPELSQGEIEKFAKYTFAYPKEKIVEAVKQFIEGNFSLKSEYAYGKCPLDPITDCYVEQLFNPKSLKRKLKKYGFKSKIKIIGPHRGDSVFLRRIWDFLTPCTVFLPRGFQLVAIKKGGFSTVW